MGFWKKKRRQAKPPVYTRLGLERLEDRSMLTAAIPIVAGHPTTFYDADGTRVLVALTGPGQGSYTLTSGGADGGGIDTLTLSGTTIHSTLTIATQGGTVAGTTINNLVIDEAVGQTVALNSFAAPQVDLWNGGQVQADGAVTNLQLRNVDAGAQINVTGNLGMNIQDFGADASLAVSGNLKQFNTRTVDGGSQISAQQITWLNVTTQAEGATIAAGAGGIQNLTFGNVDNSVITSVGGIGSALIQGSMQQSSIACNIAAGTDGVFGTIDDQVVNPSATGQIGSVEVNGSLGSTPQDDRIVASGTIGPVSIGGTDARTLAAPPLIWAKAASSYIPLSVTQAVASATGFTNSQIWIGIFGQEIATPAQGVVPPVGPSYYLDASNLTPAGAPILQSTSTLAVLPSTPNQPTLPSSTLAQWGNNLELPVPAPGMQFTGRILISVGAPIQAQVNLTNGTVAAPSAADPTDPSNGTFYDFLEFTVTNKAGVPNLDVDTSQVDSFGLPLELQFFKDAAGTQTFNFPITGTTTQGSETVTSIPNTTNLSQGYSLVGPGIPVGATIQSIVNSTAKTDGSVTLNMSATASASNVALTADGAGPVGVSATRDVVLSGTTGDGLEEYIKGQVAAGNSAASAFLQTGAPYQAIGPLPITSVSDSGPITVYTISTANMPKDATVEISGVVGTTSANGIWHVTDITPTSFVLVGSKANAAYVSGGDWSYPIGGASNPGPKGSILITTSSTLGMHAGDVVEISGVQGNTNANGLFVVSDVNPTWFLLDNSNGTGGTYTGGGSWTLYRPTSQLVSPKDLVEALSSPQDPNPLNNYFDSAIDKLFLQYYTGKINGQVGGGQTLHLVSTASGKSITYSGVVTNTGTANGGYVLQLTDPTGTDPNTYDIYYPFFTTNAPASSIYTPIFPLAAPPSWITAAGQQYESPSQMIFACDAVFADNVSRGSKGTASTVLADLENSVSAAFNRGVALLPANEWGDSSKWFQQTGGQDGHFNYWAEFWHTQNDTVSNLAYAFPYDDKFGASTNLNQDNVGLAKITLGVWNTTRTDTTTQFQNFPTSATQQGPVTLTAQVTPTTPDPTMNGTVTFYIDGVPVNSENDSASPQIQQIQVNGSGVATITALLPALADGDVTHTFTVTAVYSGDEFTAPSIAYSSLKVVGSAGDFDVQLAPGAGALGSQTTVSAMLPGSSYQGTVTISIAHQDGTGSTQLASFTPTSSNISKTVTVPASLLSFTGDLSTTTNIISNVSSVVNLVNGQTVTSGANFLPGTTISGFAPATLTLSKPAQYTGTYQFTVNGMTFQGTTTANTQLMTGVLSVTGLANGDSITGYGIQAGTTFSITANPQVTLNKDPLHTLTRVTIQSNGINSDFPIQVNFTPSVGPSYSGSTVFAAT